MSGSEGSDETGAGEGPADGEEPKVPQAGVLGNLPKTRPAVRSPRRKEQKAPARPAAAAPEQETPRPQPAATPVDSEAAAAASQTGAAGDLDALARGGIAIVGEAASLGLRIAGRAAAALRDAVERR